MAQNTKKIFCYNRVIFIFGLCLLLFSIMQSILSYTLASVMEGPYFSVNNFGGYSVLLGMSLGNLTLQIIISLIITLFVKRKKSLLLLSYEGIFLFLKIFLFVKLPFIAISIAITIGYDSAYFIWL